MKVYSPFGSYFYRSIESKVMNIYEEIDKRFRERWRGYRISDEMRIKQNDPLMFRYVIILSKGADNGEQED